MPPVIFEVKIGNKCQNIQEAQLQRDSMSTSASSIQNQTVGISSQHVNLILRTFAHAYTYQHGSFCIASTDRLDGDNEAVSAARELKAGTLHFFQMFSTVTD